MPILAIFAIQIPHFSPVFAIFDVTEPPEYRQPPPKLPADACSGSAQAFWGAPPLQKACRSELCHGLVPFMRQNGPESAKIGPKHSKIAQNCPNLVQIGPKSVQNGPNWILREFRNSAKSFLGISPLPPTDQNKKKVFSPLKLKSAHRRKYSTNNQKFLLTKKFLAKTIGKQGG